MFDRSFSLPRDRGQTAICGSKCPLEVASKTCHESFRGPQRLKAYRFIAYVCYSFIVVSNFTTMLECKEGYTIYNANARSHT